MRTKREQLATEKTREKSFCFLCSLLFKIYACKSLYLITLNRKPKSDQASLFLFGSGLARFRLFMGRRKYRAVVRQDALGLRQPRRGILAFHFDTDDELALVESVRVIFADSLPIAVGQNETAETAGDGPAAHEHWNGRK